MKKRTSRYPIGRFLIDLHEQSGLSLSDFLTSIGYRNINKGVRAFDSWIEHGCDQIGFIDRLRNSVKLDTKALEKALDEIRAMLEAENERAALLEEEKERDSFTPYIQADVEGERLTSMTLFVVTGGHEPLIVRFDKAFMEMEQAHQLELIKKAIQTHFSERRRTRFGGRICGYRYFETFDSGALYFDIQGNLLGDADDPNPSPEPELFIGKRRFRGGFY